MRELHATAEAAGFATVRIDLGTAGNKTELIERLATALVFPDWFGRNWDGLADCLGDLSWLPAAGYLILIEHCDDFHARLGEDFAIALQVFAEAADAWRDARVPFWVLVDAHADGLSFLPDVG
ncbi:MAG: barstar family protein [Rhodocyclaceae bacterium]|nr:MAG: barstar family protein [Rhodocyclaceae bacterium]MBE7424044.1 barstar family protein [Zoogloeaceae bacterium]